LHPTQFQVAGPQGKNSVMFQNYRDRNMAPSALTDDYGYVDTLAWTYDTPTFNHGGYDFAKRHFRDIMIVIAASAGTVVAVADGNPDRNIVFPSMSPSNYVIVEVNDSTYHAYFHLKRNSVAVKLGETVRQGEILGLAESSGNSSNPHLHFEENASSSLSDSTSRELYNKVPSRWLNEAPYQGDTTLSTRIFDAGITTPLAVGGGNNFALFYDDFSDSGLYIKNRPAQPIEVLYTDSIMFWSVQQATKIASAHTHFWYKDGSLSDFPNPYHWGTLHFFRSIGRYGYSCLQIDALIRFFGTNLDAFGNWEILVISGSNPLDTLYRVPFFVKNSGATLYAPRFKINSKSFRLGATSFTDNLPANIDSLGNSGLTYSTDPAHPGWISVSNSGIVTIHKTAGSLGVRNGFTYAVVNASGRRDTLFYHLVDTLNSLDNPLPVELLSFNATRADEHIVLRWETASEIDNAGFELSWRIQGGNWKVASDFTKDPRLRGKGTFTGTSSYRYEILSPTNVQHEWRITSIDFSGIRHEYPPVKVNSVPYAFGISSIYPNPFNASCRIELNVINGVEGVLKVQDILGRVVREIKILPDANNYVVEFNDHSLATGLYFFELRQQEKQSIKKALLVK
jgi:hypothetical protein